ncbi:MAG: hypothetical protein HYV97_10230 [Bdellovibrio sp.]|nr:hypothetical protein [Bdellovibrio sp.]
MKRRWDFEAKNLHDPLAQSFKADGRRAHVAFEVSSEGELEQIIPLVKSLLAKRLFIEILYCSPSVEKKVTNFCQGYPGLIRAKRMPLVTYFPAWAPIGQNVKRWMSAHNLILCRYDFFPELLAIGRRRDCHLILISGTLKNKPLGLSKNFLRYFFWKELVASFEFMAVPIVQDKERFVALGVPEAKIFTLEFRVLQIEERLSNALPTLREKLPAPYCRFLASRARSQNIIFAQAHPIDVELLLGTEIWQWLMQKNMHLSIVPHHLERANLLALEQGIKDKIKQAGLEQSLHFKMMTSAMEEMLPTDRPLITLVALKGILCELFTHFSVSYIGGGHGRSIHSVLEPYMAGCNVMCGPKIHRSTEYDYIKARSPERLVVVKNAADVVGALENFEGQGSETHQLAIIENRNNWNGFMTALEELC